MKKNLVKATLHREKVDMPFALLSLDQDTAIWLLKKMEHISTTTPVSSEDRIGSLRIMNALKQINISDSE